MICIFRIISELFTKVIKSYSNIRLINSINISNHNTANFIFGCHYINIDF